jgi:spore coat protein CotF
MNRKDAYMDISSCSSATSPYYTKASSNYQASMKDFSALADAVNSGDLSSAKSAFTQFQNDLKNTKGLNSLLNSDTQAGKDYKTLQDAFTSGDMSAVKTALQSLQQDLTKVQGSKHHHHHHHHQETQSTDTTTTNTSSTDSSSSSPPAKSINSFV